MTPAEHQSFFLFFSLVGCVLAIKSVCGLEFYEKEVLDFVIQSSLMKHG
jgi:hypothetical protein